MTKSQHDLDQVLGKESRWPEMAVGGKKLKGKGLLDKTFVCEFRQHGS